MWSHGNNVAEFILKSFLNQWALHDSKVYYVHWTKDQQQLGQKGHYCSLTSLTRITILLEIRGPIEVEFQIKYALD